MVVRLRYAAAFVIGALCGCTGAIDVAPSGRPNGPYVGGTGSSAATSAGPGAGRVPDVPGANPACSGSVSSIGPAPLRRLTRFEYNNTVRDLLGDDSRPANAFPSEEFGNGFGNEADTQSVSSLLAEQYSAAAEAIARRATESTERLGQLQACAADVTDATDLAAQEACARTLIESFAGRAYRRPLEVAELDELLAFQKSMRASSSFATSIGAVVEAVLQSPDFLYRLERGVAEPSRPDVLRPDGYEMATRLSYLLWGTLPDEPLRAAAASGELLTAPGVLAHATRMLDDPRARPIIRFFFDNLLPIASLSGLERDRTLFASFSPQIGALLREETQTFLAYEIFEGSGTWHSALTAPYTFVNEPLAAFYGISGIAGEAFQKVPLDAGKRLGLLAQAGILAGTTHSNTTSPVLRGSWVARKLMCTEIPLPTAELLGEEVFAQIKPPDPYSGATARERFTAHSANPVCATCHERMDPIGLALENFDAVGLWRDQENGVTIDASGAVPGVGSVRGPLELVQKIAESEQTQRCFASHWLDFAYGRTLGAGDECTRASVETAFRDSNYNVRQLLLSLTQSDAFLYLPAVRE